jgi:hypothetical protein
MSFMLDPRGDLPPPTIQPSSYYYTHHHRRGTSYALPTKKQKKKKQCYDWIFSTASNVHVAIDHSTFKTYTPFKSYVLTVSDQRQVSVRGIGTVELKLKREPGSRENHTIVLQSVLHVPDWLCNVFSDIFFTPASSYEHTWTEFGVSFFARNQHVFKPWGFTESFCGLDRLVLSKNHQGRSPMMEDPDREVFSVSLTWPQSQMSKRDAFVADNMKKEAARIGKSLKEEAKTEMRGFTRESKSALTDGTKWRLVPNIKEDSKCGDGDESVGVIAAPKILPRVSSLLFEGAKG